MGDTNTRVNCEEMCDKEERRMELREKEGRAHNRGAMLGLFELFSIFV